MVASGKGYGAAEFVGWFTISSRHGEGGLSKCPVERDETAACLPAWARDEMDEHYSRLEAGVLNLKKYCK
jgi:hypothetical protein